jgi:pyruvate dehydrogenase E1 component alpha subunit/2-oxoisovalerate dehydrogenase E1 component alpha subunit
LADKAVGYGVAAHSVDATNLEDCLRVLSTAVSEAREGGGPQLVVGNLLRLCGHGEHDDAHYIDAELKKSPLGRDCLKVAGERLLREHWGDGKVIRAIQREAIQEVTEAIAKVQREAGPDPYAENWCALASRHLSELFETPAPVRPPSS